MRKRLEYSWSDAFPKTNKNYYFKIMFCIMLSIYYQTLPVCGDVQIKIIFWNNIQISFTWSVCSPDKDILNHQEWPIELIN